MADVKVSYPDQLNTAEWHQMLELQWDAFDSVPNVHDRGPDAISVLTDWYHPDRFIASHLDPNTEVGRRFNANQLYTRPRVAVARDGDTIIGFAYAANNVSGGGPPEGPQNDSLKAQTIRQGKRLTVVKNHLWLREIAVDPAYQRQGVGKKLGRSILLTASPLQNFATYFWPDEIPFLGDVLEGLGAKITDEEQVEIYGPTRDSVRQVRAAGRAATALNRLSK